MTKSKIDKKPGFFSLRGGKLSSFEKVTLRLSGMRGVREYELVKKDGGAELSLYGIDFSIKEKRADRRVLQKRALMEEDEALSLLRKCRLLSWDGFYGKRPRGLLDGTDFRLEATVNGGTEISASGSQNFPRGYRELLDAFYELLSGGGEK